MARNKEHSERERLISSQEAEEEVLSLSLRPASLSDFVGQKSVSENVLIAIKAAKKRKEPLEHILFAGPPGLGKTTLAHIIANEMGTKITATSGPAIAAATRTSCPTPSHETRGSARESR